MKPTYFSRKLPALLLMLPVSTFFALGQVPRQQLTGHVTPEMTNARLVGPVPPTTALTFTVGLVIQNQEALTRAADQIADPKSPSYRKFITPEQFADSYGASPAEYQELLNWGRAHNFAVTPARNRFVATFDGSVAGIESALNIHLNYRERTDGSHFFASDEEPSIEVNVQVEHISGLENFILPQRAGGSGPSGTYEGSDFRNAYAPGMTQRGAGQEIGIFMFDGFSQADINGYAAQVHETFAPVQVIPATTTTPGEEGTLDIEMAYSMAPTGQVVAFVGNNGTTMLTNMTEHESVKQLSSSWFWYDGTTTDTNLMLQLAMQGQSFFQASGDGGAYQNGVFPHYISGSLDCRQFPYITIVGGTSLDMSGNGGSYGTLETAWSLSSGGIEASVGIPSYQLSIAGKNGASKTLRNVPDVAAQAADAHIFWKGAPPDVGGKSEATPLWAGYMALVNELAHMDSRPSVGFANPALYSIASTSAYHSDFHDVVLGCTPNGESGADKNEYCSGSGYDLTTGLGSPQHALIYALSGVQAYPLYCRGPLVTTGDSTPFKWASEGAGAQNPGPGECAWADRAPRGSEIKSGDSNTISGYLGSFANLPSGEYLEVGVFNNGDVLVATQVVGNVKPPFSSSPTLP